MNNTASFPETKHILICKTVLLFTTMLFYYLSASQTTETYKDTAAVMSLLSTGDHYKTSQPDSAIYYYEEAHQLAQKIHWDEGRSQYIRHSIFVLNNQGKYQQALALSKQELEIASASGNKKDLARGYNNVANEYQYLGELSLTVDNYLKGAELAESIHELSFLKIFDNNLSSVFFELEQYDKSYKYAIDSWKIAEQMHDTSAMAMSLVNIGVSEIHLNKSGEALQHFQEVIALSEQLDDYTLSCDAYTNMGSIEMNAHHTEQAEGYYKKLIALADKNNNPNYQILGWAGLADVYVARKEWKEAASLAQKALALAASIGDRVQMVQLYEKAAIIDEGLGDWKAALANRHQFEKLNDSLLNEKTRTHINELETRYQGAKKDQQLAEGHLQLVKSQNLIRAKNIQLYALIAGVVMLVVLVLLGRRLLRQRQKVAVLGAELKGQEQERKRIAQEMHDDLGSGLTTVLYLGQSIANGSASENESAAKKIVSTTTSLVETMNEIVWSMNQHYNSLEDLVSYIRQQSTSWMERPGLNYEMEIPETIPENILNGEVRRNIYLVIKEAMHNILKHSNANHVLLHIDFSKGLLVRISDDGIGFNANASRWGNGLTNMQERMKAVGGKFQIYQEKGTTIELSMPL